MRKEEIFSLNHAKLFIATWLVVCLTALVFIGVFGCTTVVSGIAGVGAGILLGAGKFVYDKYRCGAVSKGDLLADLFGCLAGFLCALGM